MRFICLCLLIVAMRPLPGFAQQVGSAQQGSSSYDLWLVRSQTVTADVITDSTDLRHRNKLCYGPDWLKDGGGTIPNKPAHGC